MIEGEGIVKETASNDPLKMVTVEVHEIPTEEEEEITVVDVETYTLEENVPQQSLTTEETEVPQEGFWEVAVHGNEEVNKDQLVCEECEDNFECDEQLKTHTENVHVNIEYMCTLCQFRSKSKHYLEEHKDDILGQM